MLLDSPGDTGGPHRSRGDNSPSDLVSQNPSAIDVQRGGRRDRIAVNSSGYESTAGL